MGVYVDTSEVTSGLYQFANFTRGKCRKHLQNACTELESYMKSNAPWNDRTGDARRGLKAEYTERFKKGVESEPTVLTIKLSHKVDYGVYLEYAMGLRFAILEPTVRLKTPAIIQQMRGILEKLG